MRKRIESQLQFNCCVNNFVTSFSRNATIVADLVEGGPRLERRAEIVAPVLEVKITGWPPTVLDYPRLLCGDEDEPKWEASVPSVFILGSEFLDS